MGACAFRETGRGRSAQNVFRKLQEEAQREYGDDCYNGTISTVNGFRDLTDEWKKSKKDLTHFVEYKITNANKYDCFCICVTPPVENKNKTKTQVQHISMKGTKKWLLKYVVTGIDGELGSYNTKGEAVTAARAYTEKYLSSTTVHMEKRIDRANAQVARITYKRSEKEKDGQWLFFGWAAE